VSERVEHRTDKTQEDGMDLERARELIVAERERITELLRSAAVARMDDDAAEQEAGDGDTDGAQPLEHEEVDLAVQSALQGRLDALSRAEKRLADGTSTMSIESGVLISDERLEIDPAAELTVAEAERRDHDH
jgi:DnaK suppressor protein